MAKTNALIVYATSKLSKSKAIIAKFEVGTSNPEIALELVNKAFPNHANYYIPYHMSLDLFGDEQTIKELPISENKLPFNAVKMTYESPFWNDTPTNHSIA